MEASDDTFDKFNEGVTASLSANQCRQQGNWEDAAKFDILAIEHFEAVLVQQPMHTGALGGKAMSFTQLGQTEDAIAAFQAAIAVEPMSEFHRQLGLCYVELGEMEKAWTATREAVAIEDSAGYRANAAAELFGFAKHILQQLNTNRDAMNEEQVTSYLYWGASTLALACETDENNADAKSLLSTTEQEIAQLPESQ